MPVVLTVRAMILPLPTCLIGFVMVMLSGLLKMLKVAPQCTSAFVNVATSVSSANQVANLAPAFIECGQDHRHHAEQGRGHDHGRDDRQGRFRRADELPEFLQRQAGNDRGQRLCAILVDHSL